MSLPITPSPWGKTSLEQRFEQEERKAQESGKENRLGKVITPILSIKMNGDDGQEHLIRMVGCEYCLILEIDGDAYLPIDGASVSRFLA